MCELLRATAFIISFVSSKQNGHRKNMTYVSAKNEYESEHDVWSKRELGEGTSDQYDSHYYHTIRQTPSNLLLRWYKTRNEN